MTKFFRTFSFERVASVILQLQITKGTNIAPGHNPRDASTVTSVGFHPVQDFQSRRNNIVYLPIIADNLKLNRIRFLKIWAFGQ